MQYFINFWSFRVFSNNWNRCWFLPNGNNHFLCFLRLSYKYCTFDNMLLVLGHTVMFQRILRPLNRCVFGPGTSREVFGNGRALCSSKCPLPTPLTDEDVKVGFFHISFNSLKNCLLGNTKSCGATETHSRKQRETSCRSLFLFVTISV